MFCINCGKEIAENGKFCQWCGTTVTQSSKASEERLQKTQTHTGGVTNKKSAYGAAPDTERPNLPEGMIEGPVFTYLEDDFAFMRYSKDRSGKAGEMAVLEGLDGVSSVLMKKDLLERFAPEARIDNYVWVQLSEYNPPAKRPRREFNSFRGFIAQPDIKTLYKQATAFLKNHKPGSHVLLPVKSIGPHFVEVLLGPDYMARVDVKQFSAQEINKLNDALEQNKTAFHRFLVADITQEDSRPQVTLKPIHPEELDNLLLPESLSEDKVTINQSFFECHINEEIKRQISEHLTLVDLREYLNNIYLEEKAKKHIKISRKDKNTLYFDLELNLRSVKEEGKVSSNGGAPLIAGFKKRADRKTWILSLVGFSNAGKYFENHVRITDWRNLLDELSEMALYEKWDWEGSEYKIILKRYLQYSYYKAWLDGIIVKSGNGKNQLFDTGLVDKSYNSIYCVMGRIDPDEDYRGREWAFSYFATQYGGAHSKEINKLITVFPKAPKYFKNDKLQEIVFNPDYDVVADYDHIIIDNLGRLPIQFIKDHVASDPELLRMAEEYEQNKNMRALEDLKNALDAGRREGKVDNREKIFRDIEDKIKKAVEVAKKYCRWNYKTAIPIYYPRNNGISLILPIKLQDAKDAQDMQDSQALQADVALVVQELETKRYQGETIITMEMAYQDARQICRPNSEWLTVSSAAKAKASAYEDEEDDSLYEYEEDE